MSPVLVALCLDDYIHEILLVCFITVLPVIGHRSESYFYVGGEGGYSEIKVNQTYSADGEKDTVKKIGLGLYAGYQFVSGLALQIDYNVNIAALAIFTATDSYEFNET